MKDRIITLCYRKVIDFKSNGSWDKLVFDDSFFEFRLQAQFYNQEKKYSTYAELLQNIPASSKLPFLVSAAITGYVQQLNERIPDILNSRGKQFLVFKAYQFEIINSNINNKAEHQVAVNFYSEPLIWHDTIGDQMLVSPADNKEDEIKPDLFQLRPFLAIYSMNKTAL
jgi:hypothetical protein